MFRQKISSENFQYTVCINTNILELSRIKLIRYMLNNTLITPKM